MRILVLVGWLGLVASTLAAVYYADEITSWLDLHLGDAYDLDLDDDVPQGLTYLSARETFGPLMPRVNLMPDADALPLDADELIVLDWCERQFHDASP